MTDEEAYRNIFLRPIVLLGKGIEAINRKLDEKFPSRLVCPTDEQRDAVLARFVFGGLAVTALGLLWWVCSATVKDNWLLSEFWWNIVSLGSYLFVAGGLAVAAAAFRVHAIASSMNKLPKGRKGGNQ